MSYSSVFSIRREGWEQLARAIEKMAATEFASKLEPYLHAEGRRLLAAAEKGEPRRTGELATSRAVLTLRISKKHVTVGAGYLSEHAAALHEGVFRQVKLGSTYSRFKWYERAFYPFESGFYDRAAAHLWSLIGRQVPSSGGR